jgi:hypothetical protein
MDFRTKYAICVGLAVIIYLAFTFYKVYTSGNALYKYVSENKNDILNKLSKYTYHTKDNTKVFILTESEYTSFKNSLLYDTDYNYYLKEIIVNTAKMNEVFENCFLDIRITTY